jgi:hypothetical protein
MIATATCHICGKKLRMESRGCIEAGIDVHICKSMKVEGIVEGIDWKISNINESSEEICENYPI